VLRSLAAALALASPLAAPLTGAAQQPADARADLGRGLVASYDLDGDTIDGVTRGRAPAVAVQPAPDRDGRRGGALAFDGARSTVDLGDRLEPARFTISAWVRPEANDRVMAIVSKIRNLPGHWQKNLELRLEPGGRLLLHVPSGGGWDAVQGTRAVPPGRWTHVAAVYDGRRAQLYVDGVRDGAPLAVAYAQSRAPVFLGARPEGGGRDGRTPMGPTFHFAGSMDDVRIYDRALGVGELGLLADRARPPPGPPGPVPQPPRAPRGREIVAWFPLDGDARDAASHSDGRLVGNPRPAGDRSGDPRGALAFTGREYVDLGPRTEPEQLTITAWIQPSRVDRGGAIFSKHSSAPGPRDRYLELRLDEGGHLALAIPGGARVQALRASRAVAAGRWTHVAATFDGGRAVLYVDGARDAEAPLVPFDASPGAAFLGARPEPGGTRARAGSAFAGRLDDVRLYRGVLSDQEIRALAAQRAGPGRPDDEDDATPGKDPDALLVAASRLLVRYDVVLARRDGRRIERVEEQLAGELARMERQARETRAPQPIVQRIRRAAGELHALRGRLDAPSLGRKRGALLGLSEVLWDDLARELDAAPIE
jgi:hypothetical protein